MIAMRSFRPIRHTLLYCTLVVTLRAQVSLPDFMLREREILATAQAAALRNDAASAAVILAEAPSARLKVAESVSLARRAVAVCGGLCNENKYGPAMRLAEAVLLRLAPMTERTDADRLERLYWSAWLEGEILNRRTQAIELLRAAELIAPYDERIVKLELRMIAALAPRG